MDKVESMRFCFCLMLAVLGYLQDQLFPLQRKLDLVLYEDDLEVESSAFI